MIDPGPFEADTLLYRQVYAQLRAAILSGALKPGTQLPTSRAFTQQLNVARNTVMSAYEQLMVEG
jgi:GntR family transcriptional regulator / MocR family aminotransferase